MTQKALKRRYFREGRALGLPYHLAVRYSQFMRGAEGGLAVYPLDLVRQAGGKLFFREQRYCRSCGEYYFTDKYIMPCGKVVVYEGHFGGLRVEKEEE